MSKQDFRKRLEEILEFRCDQDHPACFKAEIDGIIAILDELIGPESHIHDGAAGDEATWEAAMNAERQRIRQALGLETTNTGGQGGDQV